MIIELCSNFFDNKESKIKTFSSKYRDAKFGTKEFHLNKAGIDALDLLMDILGLSLVISVAALIVAFVGYAMYDVDPVLIVITGSSIGLLALVAVVAASFCAVILAASVVYHPLSIAFRLLTSPVLLFKARKNSENKEEETLESPLDFEDRKTQTPTSSFTKAAAAAAESQGEPKTQICLIEDLKKSKSHDQ